MIEEAYRAALAKGLGPSLRECAKYHDNVAKLTKEDATFWGAVLRASLMRYAADRVEQMEEALRHIAAYTDKEASEYLRKTGKYSLFDEPAAVSTARGVLEQPLVTTDVKEK